jgi:hypothetical protein
MRRSHTKGSSDRSIHESIEVLQQAATDLQGLQLHDAAARELAATYATHVREQHVLLAKLAPMMERFDSAVAASKQAQAADEAELAPCKDQKPLTKSCNAKLDAAAKHAVRDGLAQRSSRRHGRIRR